MNSFLNKQEKNTNLIQTVRIKVLRACKLPCGKEIDFTADSEVLLIRDFI